MAGFDLEQLLDGIDVISVKGELPEKVYGITQDSRLVKAGFIFAARTGGNVNGLDFVTQAKANGAVLVLTTDKPPEKLPLPILQVKDFHRALVSLSRTLNGDPSSKLKLICVTGTNGKTTSVHLIRSILKATGEKCGMLSTVGYDTHKREIDAFLTTPDIDCINSLLAEMVDAGCEWAVMEASSHALEQGRLDGLKIAAGAYTNLSQEHLDYHHNLEDYARAKAGLFRSVSPDGFSVINIGDAWGAYMMEATEARVITFSQTGMSAPLLPDAQAETPAPLLPDCDLSVTTLDHSLKGGSFRLGWAGDHFDIRTPLIGVYHGENIALAAGIALGFDIKVEYIKTGVENLSAVPGRMERLDMGQPFTVLVDYSHTPDALENALRSLRLLCERELIVVFGCGGDRDKTKRPEMGRVADEIADRVILTSDNPRTEDPNEIIEQIAQGIKGNADIPVRHKRATIISDRREAIRNALSTAAEGDVFLIAGKGHEQYQLIGEVRHPFDDRKVAAEELAKLGWTTSVVHTGSE
ncbi:UDP-N-acetylmuramoyl-L-alanyl-D-glutamate--2,6-diaminopimelate ligase [bacterium]|nr:UDP-N-acetylmuramoyl-L-alanyl-D-glutamate--2,6-diaminopimelate ligase [bacterium]